MAADDPPALRILLESLPQELYDEIFHLTFDHDTSQRTQKINRAYRPPIQLRVSNAIRNKFAKSYYSNTIFYGRTHEIYFWFCSIQLENRQRVQHLFSYVHPGKTPAPDPDYTRRVIKDLQADLDVQRAKLDMMSISIAQGRTSWAEMEDKVQVHAFEDEMMEQVERRIVILRVCSSEETACK